MTSDARRQREDEILRAWESYGGAVGSHLVISPEKFWTFLAAMNAQWRWDDLARVVGPEDAIKLKGERPAINCTGEKRGEGELVERSVGGQGEATELHDAPPGGGQARAKKRVR